jgi:UDP-N-acetylglucosamine/UDP-N-acetylgalactosamine diphosphorylase
MNTLHDLQDSGVIFVGPEVHLERIAPDVVLYPGCRLSGEDLSIGPGCVIGAEAPVTLNNCQLGARVHLAGGYFEESTFLDDAKAGSCSHVRPGCLLEEGASIAHSVGIKQTIFLPWVTAGSLINFCDALMAGGTSRKDHSEIGSSYIHFNFTPHQDKATASLIGDVPNGVLLKQPPIFLGGQGGLVGPAKLAFGTVIPAGQIWRGNVEKPNQLVARAGFKRDIAMNYNPNTFSSISLIVRNNLTYIGNILALDAWHRVVRSRYLSEFAFQEACRVGARKRLADILSERLHRLDELLKKVEKSFESDPAPQKENQELVQQWAQAKDALAKLIESRDTVVVPSEVLAIVNALPAKEYLMEIQGLSEVDSTILTLWLNYHVASVEKLMPCGRSSCCG